MKSPNEKLGPCSIYPTCGGNPIPQVCDWCQIAKPLEDKWIEAAVRDAVLVNVLKDQYEGGLNCYQCRYSEDDCSRCQATQKALDSLPQSTKEVLVLIEAAKALAVKVLHEDYAHEEMLAVVQATTPFIKEEILKGADKR